MSGSLEDLVRDTLAARSHDVDGVELTIHPPAPHHGRRWVAIGTVAAVAAAVLVAIVLVAPWREAPRRGDAAVTPATPPAGMRWVSFHGLTLTVPDSWRVTADPCAGAQGAPGLVVVSDLDPYCASISGDDLPMTAVRLRNLGDAEPLGDPVTVGGLAARRSDVTATSDPPQALVQVQVPDARVSIALTDRADDTGLLQTILDGIEATPVDAHGCTARLPGDPMTSTAAGRPVLPAGGEVTLCQYETAGSNADGTTATPWLIGSRLLTADETIALRELVSRADPDVHQTFQQVLGPDYGVRVFHATQDDGTTAVIVADPSSGTVAISDGTHSEVVPGSTLADLPKTYP